MFQTLKNAFKVKEIRKKIWMTLLFLLIFRLGCYIPVPGISAGTFSAAIDSNEFFGLMSAVTGGALMNATLFALGIGPYINSSIIMQLLSVGIPALERLSKQGEDGRKKIAQYTRYLAIVLAIVQAVGIIVNFASSSGAIKTDFFFGQTWLACIFMTIVYTAGSCLVMWIGDRVTEYGVGNGTSLIIFIGILSSSGMTILDRFLGIFGVSGLRVDHSERGLMNLLDLGLFVVLAVVIFFLIVTVDLAERKIPVQYAKQVKGRKMYGGQSSVIPMKISGSGVMPLIFAFSIISFPSMICNLFWPDTAGAWLNQYFSSQNWYYVIVLCLLIFAFSFFYAQIQFNAEDVSKSIQGNGGFIQGIRPGKPTADYLNKINHRITLFGAIYLSLIAFIPSLIFSIAGSDFVNVFSTTGILIVVSVALEFDKQLQSQLMMKTYKGFLK
ncbi:MAG: preprotein translocase subunit SecY [Clostridia bacterium]|nr:preprotein translocase subunit SecY [Clostridia bacterium]